MLDACAQVLAVPLEELDGEAGLPVDADTTPWVPGFPIGVAEDVLDSGVVADTTPGASSEGIVLLKLRDRLVGARPEIPRRVE